MINLLHTVNRKLITTTISQFLTYPQLWTQNYSINSVSLPSSIVNSKPLHLLSFLHIPQSLTQNNCAYSVSYIPLIVNLKPWTTSKFLTYPQLWTQNHYVYSVSYIPSIVNSKPLRLSFLHTLNCELKTTVYTQFHCRYIF